jgi:uncharacterized membrane protein
MSTTTLTVWHYESAMGAAAGEVRLKDLQQRGAVRVIDAITVTWVPGADEPHLGHLLRHGAASIARGSMLGALVGLLLLTPTAEADPGAGVAALAHRLRDTGIDEAFLEEVRSLITPGASALLVLTGEADLEAVREFVERGLARGDVRLVQATLRDGAPYALQALVDPAVGGLGSNRPIRVTQPPRPGS